VSCAKPGYTTLMATSAPPSSAPRYTCPIPPAASRPRSRYRPIVWPVTPQPADGLHRPATALFVTVDARRAGEIEREL
jgi:hypothetical protein